MAGGGEAEINFKRLLARCEARISDKGKLKDDDKIRLQKFLEVLKDMLAVLQGNKLTVRAKKGEDDSGVEKRAEGPSAKTLEDYNKRVQAFANWLIREGKGDNPQAELRARLFHMPVDESSDSDIEERASRRGRAPYKKVPLPASVKGKEKLRDDFFADSDVEEEDEEEEQEEDEDEDESSDWEEEDAYMSPSDSRKITGKIEKEKGSDDTVGVKKEGENKEKTSEAKREDVKKVEKEKGKDIEEKKPTKNEGEAETPMSPGDKTETPESGGIRRRRTKSESSRSTAGLNDLDVTERGGKSAGLSSGGPKKRAERDFMEMHQRMQDALSEDLLNMTYHLKSNVEEMSNVIKDDLSTLDKLDNLTDSNLENIKKENTDLKKQVQKSSSHTWTLWITIIIVALVFVWMIVFMKLFPKGRS